MKLIHFIVGLRRQPPLRQVTGDEERLLFEIFCLANMRQKQMLLSQVYDMAGTKSASAAYRDLMGLKEKGLIGVSVDPDDKRQRRLSLRPAILNLTREAG